MPGDVKMSDCLACKTPAGVAMAPPGVDGAVRVPQTHPPQMTVADAFTMAVSLLLKDTPVGYVPQKGVWPSVSISYNQRETEQPANIPFSNLSNDWNHSWMSYVIDDPVTGNEGNYVSRIPGGGGGYDYYTYGGFYNTTTGAFKNEPPDYSQMVRSPPTGTP